MKQAAAMMKNGWRLSNSCLRTTFRGSRFSSIGQLLTLRSASPTTSPNKCSDRASSVIRAATAQENALGRISLLLPTIMADGTHQFPVQSRHCAAYDLRNAGNIRVCRLRVHASQAHKAVALLTRFCCCEWLAKFPGNRGGD